MTYMNPDNQTHLVRFQERALIDRLVQCIRLCGSRLPRHAPPSLAWLDLLAKEKKSADEGPAAQPESSTTEGGGGEEKGVEKEGKKEGQEGEKDKKDAVEYTPDQQTLLTCLLAIFRLFVNISHSGKLLEKKSIN